MASQTLCCRSWRVGSITSRAAAARAMRPMQGGWPTSYRFLFTLWIWSRSSSRSSTTLSTSTSKVARRTLACSATTGSSLGDCSTMPMRSMLTMSPQGTMPGWSVQIPMARVTPKSQSLSGSCIVDWTMTKIKLMCSQGSSVIYCHGCFCQSVDSTNPRSASGPSRWD